MATDAEYALVDETGEVKNIIVVNEDDPSSLAVLDVIVEAKDGPHAPIKAHERVDMRKTGHNRIVIGSRRQADGTFDHPTVRRWKEIPEDERREHRDDDLPGKPTGRILDLDGKPRPGTARPQPSGPPTPKP